MNKQTIEDLLIKSVHSNEDAKNFFLNNLDNKELFYILLDIAENSYSGDARMASDYYISNYDIELLKKEEPKLLHILNNSDEYKPHIMIALARIKSEEGIKYIINERIRKEMYWEAEALNIYLGLDNKENQ